MDVSSLNKEIFSNILAFLCPHATYQCDFKSLKLGMMLKGFEK